MKIPVYVHMMTYFPSKVDEYELTWDIYVS